MPKWWEASKSEDVRAYPWLHPDVVAFLDGLLYDGINILEHGSGGSTLWFAERARKVTAYEANDEWYATMKAKVPKNVTLVHAHYPRKSQERVFDLCLVDGVPTEDRAVYLDNAFKWVKPGGVLVLDNANRVEYQLARIKFAKKADLMMTFDRNELGRTQNLVTEFYRIPEDA